MSGLEPMKSIALYPDERYAAILKPKRSFRTVPFPGQETAMISVRVLSEDELMTSRVRAQDELRATAKRRSWSDIVSAIDVDPSLFDRLASRHLVQMAFYVPDTIEAAEPKLFFPTVLDVANQPSNVITQLIEIYAEWTTVCTPLATADEERVKEIVEALGKGRLAEASFSRFGRDALLSLLLSTVKALASSQTSK